MQAQGTRVRDEAQLEAARVTLARYRTLLGQDSIARQDVDTQAALVKQLEGTVITDKAAEARRQAQPRLHAHHRAGDRPHRPAHGRPGQLRGGQRHHRHRGDHADEPDRRAVRGAAGPRARDPGAAGPGREAAASRRSTARAATTLDTGVFSTLDNVVDTTTGTVKAKARFANDGSARCSRTSSSTCSCCCAPSTRGGGAGDGAAHRARTATTST